MTPAATFRYWRAADVGPTPRELKILRHIAEGGLRVTYRKSGAVFSFADNIPARHKLSSSDFEKFVELGWILPDPGAPPLIPGLTAQRYVAAARWLDAKSQQQVVA